MYEAFFKLSQRPFLAGPRVDRYFAGGAIEQARQTLARTIERAEGSALLVGPAGTGKSLLCHVLAEQFRDRLRVAHLANARLCTRRALLQAILYELGLHYREKEEGELRLSLIDSISGGDDAGEGMLLLVDEAHALPLRLLEEIRMITNLVRNGQPRVRLLLSGSPLLEERFASPKLESFNQRIVARCYLEPLHSEETAQYVRAQIAACGGNPDELFSHDAFVAIHRATDGIARLINQVCDHALLLAHAARAQRIDAAGIEQAWADLQQLPLPWETERAEPDADGSRNVIEFGSLSDEPDSDANGFDASRGVPLRVQALDDDPRTGSVPLACEDEPSDPLAGKTAPSSPHVELLFHPPHNPFSEPFDEEEVVIDRYASLDDSVLRNRPRVSSRDAEPLADLSGEPVRHKPAATASSAQPGGPSKPLPHAPLDRSAHVPSEAGAAAQDAADFDPVLPEPEPQRSGAVGQVEARCAQPQVEMETDADILVVEDEPVAAVAPPAVRRQEYRQLFAKLRKM